jgi:hypothetical protein
MAAHDHVVGARRVEWTAKATLLQTQNITGWGELTVETNPSNTDDACSAYAAGFVEAAATPDLINLGWQNSNPSPDKKVLDFVTKNNAWVLKQVANAASMAATENAAGVTKGAIYWEAVGLTYAQLMGMAEGYAAARGGLQPLTMLQLQLLGMAVELGDIEKAVNVSARPDWSKMTKGETDQYIEEHTHCSALVRATPDLGEIYFSHVTWCEYWAMLRLFKTYRFPFKSAQADVVMFSGKPGQLASIDDFYLTSQRLAVMETTNSVFNGSLYDKITVESVPYWARVLVATRGATTAPEWHTLFYEQNSGTYNNQWMTVDYKLFTPKQPLPPNLFWVSEQMPGFHVAADQTDVLQRGHWPSYNVPFYSAVYQASGYPAMVKANGPSESYQLAPRAPIFRRDAEAVRDLAGMQRFMRLNKYDTVPNDPLFPTPYSAIAARGDLMAAGGRPPRPGGAVDAKITSGAMARAMVVNAVSGPTHDDQPVFAWLGEWGNITKWKHYGQPTSFPFGWVNFTASV